MDRITYNSLRQISKAPSLYSIQKQAAFPGMSVLSRVLGIRLRSLPAIKAIFSATAGKITSLMNSAEKGVVYPHDTRKLRKIIGRPLFAKKDGYPIHLRRPIQDRGSGITLKDFVDPELESDLVAALKAMGTSVDELPLSYVFKRNAGIPDAMAGSATRRAAMSNGSHGRAARQFGWPKHPHSFGFNPYPGTYEGDVLVKGGMLPTSKTAKKSMRPAGAYPAIRLVKDSDIPAAPGSPAEVFATTNPSYAQMYGNAMVAVNPVAAQRDKAGRVVVSQHLGKATASDRLENYRKLRNASDGVPDIPEAEAILKLVDSGQSSNILYLDVPLTRKGWVARFGTNAPKLINTNK